MTMTRDQARAKASELRATLKTARNRQGVSLATIAERIKVSEVTPGSWERGDRAVKLSELVRWADACGLELRLVPAGLTHDFDPVEVAALIGSLASAYDDAMRLAKPWLAREQQVDGQLALDLSQAA